MEHQKRRVGNLGEKIACQYLEKLGFSVIERNYLRKCGEIDIIALKNKNLYFIEVKSVTCTTFSNIGANYRPEENVNSSKIKRLKRTINLYLLEKRINNLQWEFVVVSVYLNIKIKRARVNVLYDVL